MHNKTYKSYKSYKISALRSPVKSATYAFSLIEVNLAILVIGLGLMVLFGLFPSGLREGERAVEDTQSALFAATVMDGLRAKVSTMTWSEWQNLGNFKLDAGDLNGIALGPGLPIKNGNSVSGWIEFPVNSKTYVRYVMQVTGSGNERTRGVTLWVWSGKYAPTDVKDFKNQAEWYYTRYYYSGVQ